mgnify:CR=1 FL=1
MGIAPGLNYAGSPVRVGAHFEDDDGDDIDPTTITFTLRSPQRVETSYVYGTDEEITKSSEGDYFAEVTPDEGGRWLYAWSSTGTNRTIRFEGSFIVQASEFDAYVGTWGGDYA